MPGWPKNKKILLPSNDLVARMTFINEKPLYGFVRDSFGFRDDQMKGITLIDPNFYPESAKGKRGIGDIRVSLPVPNVNLGIEFQKRYSPAQGKRWLFYLHKMGADPVEAGKGYDAMPRPAFMAVTLYDWLSCKAYHSWMRFYEPELKFECPDSPWFRTFEPGKAPAKNDGSRMWWWARLFLSSTPEELDWLAENGGEYMAATVLTLKKLSADQAARRRAEAHEKWLWDQTAREQQSRTEGAAEALANTARSMLLSNVRVADVAKFTGLSEAEITRLAAEAKA